MILLSLVETEGSKTEVDVLWPRDESKWYGKGYDAGIRRGKKKKRKYSYQGWVEEILISGMNLAELRDAVEDRDLWRKLEKMVWKKI